MNYDYYNYPNYGYQYTPNLTRNAMPYSYNIPSSYGNISNPSGLRGLFTPGVASSSTPGVLSNLLGNGARAASAPGIASAGLGTAARTGFSWGGLLNGASRTLGVVNQAIPIFYQAKPIWNNAKTMFRVSKAINEVDDLPDKKNYETKEKQNISSSNEKEVISQSQNAPKFFV